MHLARRRSRRVVHPSTSPSILIQSRSCLLCLVRTLRLNSLAHWHSHHIIISCAVDLHLPRYEVFLAPLAAPPHDHVVDSLLTRSDSLAHRLSRARDQSLTTRQRPCEARSSTYTAVLSVTHTTRQVTRPVLCMQKQQTTQLNSSRALGTRFMFSGDNTPSWFKHASRRTTLDHSTENSLASLPLDTCRRLWWQLCPSALTEDMALTLVKDLTWL